MMWTEFFGYVAAGLTTTAFVPQALQSWRTRRTEHVSLGMYLIFTIGVALWLLYGVLAHAWPVVIANAVTLVLAVFILALKLRFG
jgi:MtN3 and saliva related transmembrane protein